MKKQISHKIVSLVFGVLILCFAIVFYAVGWDEPLVGPPGCTSGQPGCDAPINVSNTPQIKSGSLRLGGLTVDNDTYLATSAGKVGIGTASPQDILHIDVNAGLNVILASTGGIGNDEDLGGVLWKFGDGTGNEAGRIWVRGNSDSGASGQTRLSFGAHGNAAGATSEMLTIQSLGNVGIGTTNPLKKLHVVGGIKATGGIDPPFISFTNESHQSIRQFAKEVTEEEKVMQFWNGETHRLEVYVIKEDKFYTITGELIKE